LIHPPSEGGSLHWPGMGRILLVCTGNICRSPMAEAFIRHELDQRGIGGISVESSGVSGWEGSPTTPEAADALREYGLDVSEHRGRRLDRTMLESAELVVGLSAEHRDAVAHLLPQAATRTFTLKELVYLLEVAVAEPADVDADHTLRSSVRAAAARREADPSFRLPDEDVADPVGLGIETYRAVAWEIEDLSRRMVDGLFPDTDWAGGTREEGLQGGRSNGRSRAEGEAG
jgi:protein-tyrosine phosphatase